MFIGWLDNLVYLDNDTEIAGSLNLNNQLLMFNPDMDS